MICLKVTQSTSVRAHSWLLTPASIFEICNSEDYYDIPRPDNFMTTDSWTAGSAVLTPAENIDDL